MFVAGDAPTISEVLLLPTDSSLNAPAWVPWSERLADYQLCKLNLKRPRQPRLLKLPKQSHMIQTATRPTTTTLLISTKKI